MTSEELCERVSLIERKLANVSIDLDIEAILSDLVKADADLESRLDDLEELLENTGFDISELNSKVENLDVLIKQILTSMEIAGDTNKAVLDVVERVEQGMESSAGKINVIESDVAKLKMDTFKVMTWMVVLSTCVGYAVSEVAGSEFVSALLALFM